MAEKARLKIVKETLASSPGSLRLLVIANACQTVDETLAHYRLNATDAALLEANNEYYLARYRNMIPTLGGERREIVDALNFVRREDGLSAIDEHNSCSLNGIYLYSFLEEHGYRGKVELLDNFDLDPSRAQALALECDVVLLSTTFITSAKTIERVISVLREWNPRLRVVAGGAKLTQFAHDSELFDAARLADALVLSPSGEGTLMAILRRYESNQGIDDLPNLALWRDGGFVRTAVDAHDGADIDDSAPRWGTLPSAILRTSVNLRTGRGCPFKCKFCTFPSYNDQNVDLMATDTVLAQLRDIRTRPEVKTVRFVDDTLFLSKKHLIEVCKGMIAMGFDIPWTAYLRASTLTRETATYLRDAGCRLVLVGVESADQRVLDNMLKGTKEAHNWEAAENLARAGILGFAFILVGFPGETDASVTKSIDFLNNSGIHAYVHSPLFVFPNSPVAREAQKFGLVGGFNDWRHDTMDCREAIDQCGRVFEEVKNAAYIDRGSSITKVLLDHGYSVDEARTLSILHNTMAREERAGHRAGTLEAFAALARRASGTARAVGAVTSPYTRTGPALHINAGARY